MSLRYKGGVISATPPTTTGGENGTAPGVWTLQQQMQAQAAGTWPLYVPFGSAMRSLRFNSADTTYLARTPASAGNRKTWTISFWFKRSAFGARQDLFVNTNTSGYEGQYFEFYSDDTLQIGDYGTSGVGWVWQLRTTQVFRDPSAWYHIVVALDTTQATSSNRVKIYINGSQVTAFGTANYPTQNLDAYWNSTAAARFGLALYNSQGQNGYATEMVFVDGQALTPSSFGQTNSTTGVWEPKAITGLTYGTNGFYLKFQDNSGTTATTLGKDSSGNGNNWTPNNFSVTAGVGNDSLVDTPTPYGTDTGAGGEVRGNYCTLNPISNSAGALSNGALNQAGTSSSSVRSESTMAVSSGKWYFEVTVAAQGSSGLQYTSVGVGTVGNVNKYPGEDATSYAWYPEYVHLQNSGSVTSYGSSVGVNGVIMIALDLDNNKVFFGGNGTWFGSSNPATGSNPAFSISSGTYTPISRPYDSSAAVVWNFGQRPFAYTAPSGYKALCTQNLPTPTVVQGDDYFNTVLYTGDGTSNRSITGYDFAPGLIWLKSRSNAYNHRLVNSIDGVTKTLASNLDTSEVDASSEFISLNSNGFTVTQGASFEFNHSTYTYVAWGWLSAASSSTNTNGTITSTVRANTTSGFSVVTYTGNGTVGATVGHGLGATPGMVIVKNKSSAQNWPVKILPYMAGGDRLELNTTTAIQTESAGTGSLWNATNPNSTVITLGNQVMTNANTNTYVAYCFAPIAGFSAFGSYTGNGSADGPFVYTGFRPAFVLYKRSSASGNDWRVTDATRSTYNSDSTAWLYPDLSSEENANGNDNIDILSNGFKQRAAVEPNNASGSTYIYAAFAQNPFKYALAR